MKKTLLIVGLGLALAAPAASGAGQAAADVSGASTIESVTIYQNRCMITRTLTGDVVPGLHTWEFRDLPIQLLEESVRVSGRGTAGARIIDIRIQQALGSESSQASIKELEKKRDDLTAQLLEVADRLDVLAKEAELVKGVSVLKPGDDKSAAAGQAGNAADWQRRLDFIESQLPKILEQTRRLNAEKNALEKKRGVVQHDLDQQASLLVRQRKAVLVDVDVTKAGTEKLSLSYVVPGVTWSPSYDIRIDSQKDEATLTYQALVSQTTGEDWNNVQLFLSTAEPALQSRPRRLEAWRVDTASGERGAVSCFVTDSQGTPLAGATVILMGGAFRRSLTSDVHGRVLLVNLKPGTYSLRAQLPGFKVVVREGLEVRPGRRAGLDLVLEQASLEEEVTVAAKVSYDELAAVAEEAPAPEEEAAVETAEAADRTMATVFEIKQRQNVPSSRERKKVTIAVEALPVEKEFLTVPKLAETISLNARITNAAEFLLLPGPAGLFYDNDYISTADVPLVASNDHFTLAVGDVPGVKVRWRQVSKTRTETGLVGKKVQLTYEIAISLENLTRSPRTVLVKDQVPVTTSKDVTVDILQAVPEPVKTVLDEDEARSGILAWPVTLGPQEKKVISLKFRITHPKNRPLVEG
ncbi:MAG TPA: mucoidy inhibitor MuiA family protein [Candidatus Aminicenantes bacterium]|nr:mucoidy inhibitor MuiA family protein [Candidatus Aminicenantes bacterium]HRY64540.1 mucoidy inhibitor MuiA family protein [Candidatus Aminicenantes bacterium]HRZ71453.1 mucoidy inhibitor MuiA family protein [Candidatus Aminicenantes bacterium]